MTDAAVGFVRLPGSLEVLHDVLGAASHDRAYGEARARGEQDVDAVASRFEDVLAQRRERDRHDGANERGLASGSHGPPHERRARSLADFPVGTRAGWRSAGRGTALEWRWGAWYGLRLSFIVWRLVVLNAIFHLYLKPLQRRASQRAFAEMGLNAGAVA
jgi:hypothetical protein